MKRFALIALLLPVFAWGQEATVAGVGTQGCGIFVSDKQADKLSFYSSMQWVQGYLTGVNAFRAFTYKRDSTLGEGMDGLSLSLWLENYCREHPLERLYDAATALVNELAVKQ